MEDLDSKRIKFNKDDVDAIAKEAVKFRTAIQRDILLYSFLGCTLALGAQAVCHMIGKVIAICFPN